MKMPKMLYKNQGWVLGYRPYFREWLHRYFEKKCVKYAIKFHRKKPLTKLERIKFSLCSKAEFALRNWIFPVSKWKPELKKGRETA